MTFLEYMNLGGAIMWVILFMSVAATAFIIERLFFFSSESSDAAAVESAFARAIDGRGVDEARDSFSGGTSLQKLFLTACDNWDMESDGIKDVLDGTIRSEMFRWEKNLFFLEITAKVSTLLGLLGTVLGMVEMFHTLNIGGSVTSGAVTGGIWKALFTTVMGLSVAIPMIVIHGFLERRIAVEDEKLRRGADFIIKRCHERKKGIRRA
ncbi:MAG: MotA/TolQ/ExbB proton channel family protein [Synergistaceae bacterium]|jgi:biopolymer transport protein ExbB|nr:MotA/TolQ/ExbB proton channel family protein [Synergistaceae bacterium]